MEHQQQHSDMHAAVSQRSSNNNDGPHAPPTLHQYPPSTSVNTPTGDASLPPSGWSGPSVTTPVTTALPTPPPPSSFGPRSTSNVSTERPRSIIEVAVNTGTTNPAGRQVRVQWLNEARTRWDSLPRTSVIYLSYKTFMTLAKLVTTIVILALATNLTGCTLLGLMMILYTLHAVIDYPFAFLRQLQPIQLNQPLTPLQRLMIHEKSLMEVLGTCIFFVSNYFLFQSGDCRRHVPILFYGLLGFVIIDYIGILIPLILCLAAIFCMPFLIRVLTSLDIALGLAGPTGATEDLINTIPIVKYRKPVSASTSAAVPPSSSAGHGQAVVGGPATTDHASSSPSAPTTRPNDMTISIDATEPSTGSSADVENSNTETTSASTGKQKQRQWRFGFGFPRKGGKRGESLSPSSSSSSSTSPQKADEYLTLEDEQDATCSICLCEYEDDEELRKMPCLHYFHKSCVDEWLKLHKSCPLCKRDIDEGTDERSRSR
ncbi:cytochrome c oxidase subunit 1 [Actinomortierella wolfii]|nr:cytochrome c oxidase subunit 1 [Actinomortierella wolfii]